MAIFCFLILSHEVCVKYVTLLFLRQSFLISDQIMLDHKLKVFLCMTLSQLMISRNTSFFKYHRFPCSYLPFFSIQERLSKRVELDLK